MKTLLLSTNSQTDFAADFPRFLLTLHCFPCKKKSARLARWCCWEGMERAVFVADCNIAKHDPVPTEGNHGKKSWGIYIYKDAWFTRCVMRHLRFIYFDTSKTQMPHPLPKIFSSNVGFAKKILAERRLDSPFRAEDSMDEKTVRKRRGSARWKGFGMSVSSYTSGGHETV